MTKRVDPSQRGASTLDALQVPQTRSTTTRRRFGVCRVYCGRQPLRNKRPREDGTISGDAHEHFRSGSIWGQSLSTRSALIRPQCAVTGSASRNCTTCPRVPLRNACGSALGRIRPPGPVGAAVREIGHWSDVGRSTATASGPEVRVALQVPLTHVVCAAYRVSCVPSPVSRAHLPCRVARLASRLRPTTRVSCRALHVASPVQHAVCRVSHVACCLSSVACRLSHVPCRVACSLSRVPCLTSRFAACHMFHAACPVPPVRCPPSLSRIRCRVSRVLSCYRYPMSNDSNVTCRASLVSPVVCRLSRSMRVACHMPPCACHLSRRASCVARGVWSVACRMSCVAVACRVSHVVCLVPRVAFTWFMWFVSCRESRVA